MKIINTALCAYGLSGKIFHAPFLDIHPGFHLIGAWERSKKLIQQDYPAVKSYSSLPDLLADESVELVIVNTPTYTHYDYAKEALLAGKHVVVEKAFTTTVAEAIELKELAEKQGKKLSVYQNRRWDSDFQTVKAIAEQGILGDIIEAEFSFERYRPNLNPKQHLETPNPGAGIIKDLGPHIIDQALHLFGMPEAVFADLRITRQKSQVEDYFAAILYYEQLRVSLKASFLVREPAPAYILHGTKGSFIQSRNDKQEENLRAGVKLNTYNCYTEDEKNYGLLHTDKKEKVKSVQGNYLKYYNALYESIVNEYSVAVTAEDGINVMKIIAAAIKSNKERKVIKTPHF